MQILRWCNIIGKFGSFISYRRLKGENVNGDVKPTDNVGYSLCQHIIGMSPSKIGEYNVDEPSKNSNDEKILIYQDFLFDETKTVGEILNESQIEILDFKRFECGEAEPEKTTEQ